MKKALYGIFVLFFGLQAAAVNPSPPAKGSSGLSTVSFERQLARGIQALEARRQFEVHFRQEVYSVVRETTTTSQGVLWVKRPQSFLFRLDTPRREIYQSDGKTFWKYVPALKHAQRIQSQFIEMRFLCLLVHPSCVNEQFIVSPASTQDLAGSALGATAAESARPSQGPTLAIKLVPKEDKQKKVLYAILNLKQGTLDELRIEQPGGNRVHLWFFQTRERVFPQGAFSFVPPAGVVVDYQ